MALMKAGWNLISNSDDLWVKVLKSKYGCGNDLVPRVNSKRMGTNFWRGICHVWPNVTSNIDWRVGDGELINCWSHNWVPSMGKLCDVVRRPLTEEESEWMVAKLGSVSGGWNLDAILDIIQPNVHQKLLSLAAPNAARGRDKIAWKLTTDGHFTNASSYVSLLDQDLQNHSGLFRKIWGWAGPERIKLHMWKVAHEALVTNSWRKRRLLCESAECPMCLEEDESVIHTLRDCRVMKQVWSCISSGLQLGQDFFTDNLHQWLNSNLGRPYCKEGVAWAILFGSSLSIAWQSRNERVFQHVSSTCEQLAHRIKA